MNELKKADEIVKALRWLAKDTEFVFAAENLNDAADLIESMQAEVTKWKERHNQAALNFQQENRENAKLQAQLSASQRREKAAVEGLEHLMEDQYDNAWICDHCAKKPAIGETCKECNPKWNGPQAEKGEADGN